MEGMQSHQDDHAPAPLEKSISSLEMDYAPLSPTHAANPYSDYVRMRREQPVFFSSFTHSWVVSRYEDVLSILKDPQRFSMCVMQMSDDWFTPETAALLKQSPFAQVTNILSVDPPIHTRLRAPITKAISAQRIAGLESRIRQFANQLIDKFTPSTGLDFIEYFARPFPIGVISSLMNVPEKDLPKLQQWNSDRSELLTSRPSAERQLHLAQSYVAIEQYMLNLVEQRQKAPQDDIVSDLIQAMDSGQASLSIPEAAYLLYFLFGAGFETTVKFLGNALLVLLSDRSNWQNILEHPENIPNVAEELLRFASPSLGTFRRANEDVKLGGRIIPKGAMAQVLMASADHDETIFPDAETFDPLREKANRHIAFGYGPHFCLGAPLARLETCIALEQLSQRLPSLRLVPGQEISYIPSIIFHGFERLLVEWDA
jgi:cytochrome P450